MLNSKMTIVAPLVVCVLVVLAGSAPAAQLAWVAGGDGAWEVPGNWLTDDAVPVNRVPADGDSIRPSAGGATITYSAATGTQALGGSTVWQDSGANTTRFLQTGGDLEVNQIYLTSDKTAPEVDYKITGGSLFVNRNMNMTWNNSGSVDSRFVQAGGSVRIGNSSGEGLWMCIKSTGQVAYYDLEAGDFEAYNVGLGSGGANSTAVFTQSPGTTATINAQLRLGQYAGATGAAIYNLDGGVLTIEGATPFLFAQPGGDVYFDFDGGTLNLAGPWDFAGLTGIADSKFLVHGEAATAANLAFAPAGIPGADFTAISAYQAPEGEVPEPATMALLGLAACGLGGYVRKRRRA